MKRTILAAGSLAALSILAVASLHCGSGASGTSGTGDDGGFGSAPTGPSAPKPFLYVADSGSNDLTLFAINADGSLTNIGSAGLSGASPTGLFFTTSGNRLFITLSSQNSMTYNQVDFTSGIPGQIGKFDSTVFGNSQVGPMTMDSGTNLYVGSANGHITHIPVDPTTGNLSNGVTTAVVYSMDAMAEGQSGKFVYYVSNSSSRAERLTISTADGSINATYGDVSALAANAVTGPRDIKLDPTSAFAFISNQSSGHLNSYTVNSTSGLLAQVTSYQLGSSSAPYGIAVHPNPNLPWVYVALKHNSQIAQFTYNTTTGSLGPSPTSTIATQAGGNPEQIAIDPDGKYLYVTNNSAGTINAYSIDQATGALTALSTATYTVGTSPTFIVSAKVSPQ